MQVKIDCVTYTLSPLTSHSWEWLSVSRPATQLYTMSSRLVLGIIPLPDSSVQATSGAQNKELQHRAVSGSSSLLVLCPHCMLTVSYSGSLTPLPIDLVTQVKFTSE